MEASAKLIMSGVVKELRRCLNERLISVCLLCAGVQ